jgi:hypothetical protein
MGYNFLTKLPQTKTYRLATLAVLAVGLVACDAAIEDVEIAAKKDLEQKYSERKMKIEKIELQKDSNGDYNGSIVSQEDAGKIGYKLTITTDKEKKLVYSISRDKDSTLKLAEKCIEQKGFSVESTDIKQNGEMISGTAVINTDSGANKYAVEIFVLEDNTSTCSVDFTKESLSAMVKESIIKTLKEKPYIASMPEEVEMRIEDFYLVKKDENTYSGLFNLKFDGIYGYDEQLDIDVKVDPSDLSFVWKTR